MLKPPEQTGDPSQIPRRGSFRWLIRSCGHGIQFFLNDLFHLSDPPQVRVDVPFFFPIENLFPVHVHFEAAIGTWGEGDGSISTKGAKELVRHPRGGSVMLSGDAVHNIQQHFPFRGHRYSPSSE